MTISQDQADWFAGTFRELVDNVSIAVLGKPEAVRLAVTCLLADGHLLLEDVPGTGKTSLAKALANTIAGSQSRIQFTPDLLPSDVTGATIYNQATGSFEFHKGPVFASVVLVDEVNRASPKTQSALLEVMEEGRVTVDGTPHDLGDPFMVIATQNPVEQAGVYPLPEAQLDRFLMRTSLGYPDHDTNVALLGASAVRDRSGVVEPKITSKAVGQMTALAAEVHTHAAILSYITRLAEATRVDSRVKLGVSPRGCLALTRAAKVWALTQTRAYVTPDDVKALVEPVFGHRIILTPDAEFSGVRTIDVVGAILDEVDPPTERAAS